MRGIVILLGVGLKPSLFFQRQLDRALSLGFRMDLVRFSTPESSRAPAAELTDRLVMRYPVLIDQAHEFLQLRHVGVLFPGQVGWIEFFQYDWKPRLALFDRP